jgi:hypothetical protein
MQLEDGICHSCALRDSRSKIEDGQPFLINVDNNMDPGDLDGSLPELSQLEEMCIACAHVHICLGPSVPLYGSFC